MKYLDNKTQFNTNQPHHVQEHSIVIILMLPTSGQAVAGATGIHTIPHSLQVRGRVQVLDLHHCSLVTREGAD